MSSAVTMGILGTGHIGSVHLQSGRTIEGVSVVTAADAVERNRRLAAELGAARTYEDYADLLESEEPDIAVVALPPFLHAAAAKRAAERGCHVFVEKPLARTVAEAQGVVDATSSAGVALGVDHTLRYHPEMQTLKDRYDEGTLGHVPLCHLARVNSGPFEPPPPTASVPDWQLDPEATGGGAVIDLGVHLFDLLEWFFGEMEVRHASLDRQLDLDYEDTAAVTLRAVETGTTATMHCGFYQWEHPPDVNLRFRLDGIARTAESTDYVPDFYVNAARSTLTNVFKRLAGRDPDYFSPTYYYRAQFDALREFVEAVREGRDPPVGGHEGVRALELVEATYELGEEHAGRQDDGIAVERERGVMGEIGSGVR